jgi:hypothetical protein
MMARRARKDAACAKRRGATALSSVKFCEASHFFSMDKVCLCPKEVGARLGVSTRLAQSLMRAGEIESFRVGVKLLRTTGAKVEAYQARQWAAHAARRAA